MYCSSISSGRKLVAENGDGKGNGMEERLGMKSELAEKQINQRLANQGKDLDLTLSIKESHWEI